MQFELMLLAGARVAGPGQEPVVLERKTAALLALLAFERTASRARISSLLWPAVSSVTARANLRQLLRRLRSTAQGELVEGADALRLRKLVQVDALDLGRTGELLAGYEYDDCPELADWLFVQREHCRNAQRAALSSAADRLEKQGELPPALELARRLTALHPESEHAHRRVMRLCHALGDRPAAIHAFEMAQRLLRRLCDSELSPETMALIGAIRRQQRG